MAKQHTKFPIELQRPRVTVLPTHFNKNNTFCFSFYVSFLFSLHLLFLNGWSLFKENKPTFISKLWDHTHIVNFLLVIMCIYQKSIFLFYVNVFDAIWFNNITQTCTCILSSLSCLWLRLFHHIFQCWHHRGFSFFPVFEQFNVQS